MKQYVILIGLAHYADLGADAERHRSDRLSAIHRLIFSLGPAWTGSANSILLKASTDREEIIRRVSPLLGDADFVGVMAIEATSITTIGWNPDDEGLDALYPDIVKWGISPSGYVYPLN